MGNCVALVRPNTSYRIDFTKNRKVLRVVRTDGKILEFRVSVLVKDLLLEYEGYGVGVSKKAMKHLPPNYKLKVERVYYLLPCAFSVSSANKRLARSEKDCSNDRTRRIKVVITRQQLEELMLKKTSIENVLSSLRIEAVEDGPCTTRWRPKLETIPEENE